LFAKRHSLGLPLLLAGLQIARAGVANGDESGVIDLLSTGDIKSSATWCFKKPGPERCDVTLRIKDGSLIVRGVGCGSFRAPVNGSNGRQTSKITGNTITVSVAGNSGASVNTYELSPDLSQCSHTVECPAGFQAKAISCSVERIAPTKTNAQQNSSDKSAAKTGDEGPLGPARSGQQNGIAHRIDPQSYIEAARDLREREPDDSSLSAAAQTFRKAAAAYQAVGDLARARAASDEAQEADDLQIADEREGKHESKNDCGRLRGSAFQCYIRATRLQPSSSAQLQTSGQVGALLDCEKTYCIEMQKAACPMPLFGKDGAGFCFTTATDDADVVQQKSSSPK